MHFHPHIWLLGPICPVFVLFLNHFSFETPTDLEPRSSHFSNPHSSSYLPSFFWSFPVTHTGNSNIWVSISLTNHVVMTSTCIQMRHQIHVLSVLSLKWPLELFQQLLPQTRPLLHGQTKALIIITNGITFKNSFLSRLFGNHFLLLYVISAFSC